MEKRFPLIKRLAQIESIKVRKTD